MLLFAPDFRSGRQHFYRTALCYWLLLVNALTTALYGVDKMAARRAWRRVPEATLLAFGVLGGWAGAIAGQQLFRHKTQKQPFRTRFIISTIVSLSGMVAIYLFSPFSFH